MKKNKKNNDRRAFLSEGLKAGGGFLAGLRKLDLEDSEKVKILTADGQVVEVARKHLPTNKNKRTGNTDILNWMNNPSKK